MNSDWMANHVENRLRFDATVCSGCLNCVITCAQERIGRSGPTVARMRIDIDSFGGPHRMRVCRHCDTPDCVEACPSDAMTRNEKTGVWAIDPETCVGCLSCVDACSYEVLFASPKKDQPLKCDLCHGEPVCVEACAFGALQVEAQEPGSKDV